MGISTRFENYISSLLARNVGIHLYQFLPIRNVQGGSRTSWLIQSCIGLISAIDHSAGVLTCINDGFLYLQTCWYQLGYSLETYRMFRDVAWIRFIGPYLYGTFTNRSMYGWRNYHTYKHTTSAYAQIFYWGEAMKTGTKLDFKQALQQHCYANCQTNAWTFWTPERVIINFPLTICLGRNDMITFSKDSKKLSSY